MQARGRKMWARGMKMWRSRRMRVGGQRMLRPSTKRLVLVIGAGWLGVFLVDRLLPPPLDRARECSTVVLDREGAWVHAFPTAAGRWRFPAEISGTDPEFLRRLIAMEDRHFRWHPGFDAAALVRAAATSIGSRRIVSGGSTITMQAARLLEPRQRTLRAKLIEIARAMQIEIRLSKPEILELYLTLAPYGGNLEGVRAACLAYFGHEPSRLTDAEIAFLIAMPQAPEARRPDRHPETACSARGRVLARFEAKGFISSALAVEADDTPVPRRKPFSGHSYHATARLARAAQGAAAVHSTLDLHLQSQVETLARSHATRRGADVHAALLAVDNHSNAVRVAVASSGLHMPGGWIDLTRARRSPGSALKPFVYGLAFDDGIAAPGTIVDDAPRKFSGYMPENFDKTFHGQVRVREALQHSLNVPAVTALDRIGARRFWSALAAAGAKPALPHRAESEPGLALALGGAGVTLEELARLYTGLAHEGVVRALAWTAEEERLVIEAPGHCLMTPASARAVADILRSAPSPAGRVPARLVEDAPQIAFKTGTSYGYRDAWAMGFTEEWTVVVWVGRASGEAQPGETGRASALPLLFDIFDVLPVPPREPREVAHEEETPHGLMTFASANPSRPIIVFPGDGVEVFVHGFGPTARGVSLASRGGAGVPDWYVSGRPVSREPTSGQAVWRPAAPGFYRVEVVDENGARAEATVRVRVAGDR